MTRALTMNDVLFAGIAIAAGLVAAFLLRMLLRWLGRHADRTHGAATTSPWTPCA
ncbi:hypothetical protein SHIRM173S_12645 [Streptomyces hirsutus]